MTNSKTTDKLAILADVAKAFIPQLGGFKKVKVEVRWIDLQTESGDITVPNISIELERC